MLTPLMAAASACRQQQLAQLQSWLDEGTRVGPASRRTVSLCRMLGA